MSNKIIETIGKWGVKTSDGATRMSVPRPGDPVVTIGIEDYPFNDRELFRIDAIKPDGRVVLVAGEGYESMFLNEDGTVSTSGGPFVAVDLKDLVPAYELRRVRFWNWGDNHPGAHQGVDYYLDRPVFHLRADANHSFK